MFVIVQRFLSDVRHGGNYSWWVVYGTIFQKRIYANLNPLLRA